MAMLDATQDLREQTTALFRRKRMVAFAIPALILVYLTYIFFAFDIPELYRKSSSEKALILVADSYSYKTHVSRDNRSGEVAVAIEGEKKGRYPEGTVPEWVQLGETTVIDLEDGYVVTYGPETITFDVPGYGTIKATPSRSKGVVQEFPTDGIPEWVNSSKNRLTITTKNGRLSVTRNRTETFRYFTGWELFFFGLESPYYGKSFGELVSLAFNGEAGAISSEFWNNPMWLHKDVFWAIWETILMAFLGTLGGAILALPIAFLAAKNFTPLVAVRQVVRRFLDFLRGVDALIWTIVLTRAFGLGPLTGALAILITDTGSFGKMFSEALENVDDKQIEGIRSTGAKPMQRYRFGVIPQVTPVLLSQVLYYLESNTRSATIIGAITGGGIGLLLTQAMITQKDWEEVTYYIILIVLVVMAMDWISGKVRQRLIKGKETSAH